MPKISIIMPVYNKQAYLKNSLDSVLNQVFSDFELIAVDDGSTDESLKILKKYEMKDGRIRVIHTENHGVSHARNVGLDNSEGEWIQFLDGDDLIGKEYLLKCQEVIKKYDPDILFTSFQKVSENGEALKYVNVPLEGLHGEEDLRKNFLEIQKTNGFYGFISNKLVNRSLINRCKARFNENLELAEDLDFFVQCYTKIEKVYYLQENSFSYLQTAENYSFEKTIDYFSQLNIQKRIRQWIIDSGDYDDYKEIVDSSVCRYAAYAVFDASMKDADIISVCETLLKDDDVRDCLNHKYVDNKVHKKIISSLEKKEINRLTHYLKTRERIKKLIGRK